MIDPTQENEPSNSLSCGHADSWRDEDTDECTHIDCQLNRAERAFQRSLENYYGASTPQTLREQMDVESRNRK